MKTYWTWATPRKRRRRVQKKIDARYGALRFLPRPFRNDPFWEQPGDDWASFRVLTKKKTVKKPPTRAAGILWFEHCDRTVKLSWVGDCRVSTVFLGIPHPPMVSWFETMVFDLKFKTMIFDEALRYETWPEAADGHEQVLQRVQEFIAEACKNSEDSVKVP